MVKENKIESEHNKNFKQILRLATEHKFRKKQNQTILEGVNLCRSFLEQKGLPVNYFYTDSALENKESAEIIKKCQDFSVPGFLVGEGNFKKISQVKNGIGIIFTIQNPDQKVPDEILNDALVLDDIQDPGNLGTILRTAAAAGIKDVFLSKDSVSAWSPKVLRSGMGAHFVLNIYEKVDLVELIKNSQIPVLATSLEAKKSVYECNLKKPSVWIFGNEGNGVSEELLNLVSEPVIIPQNPNIESLNIASSVAICLFEQVRQRL